MPVVLGPQYPTPNLPAVLSEVGPGRIVVISSGWRMDELELGPLQRAIGRVVTPLPLYSWFDRLSDEAPALAARYRARQDRARRYSELYRSRLHHALIALRDLRLLRDGDTDVVDAEIGRAAAHVRALDDELIARHDDLDVAFPELARPWEHPAVAPRHAEVRALLDEAVAVLVPGGHVAVLANRMQTFGLAPLLKGVVARGVPLVAWSGGAMVLSDRIVLFYDDPPQGPGDPEVLGPGLGLLGDVVWFPHAATRLRLDDPARVAENALRFSPAACVALDNGARVRVGADGLVSEGDPAAARTFRLDGLVEPL